MSDFQASQCIRFSALARAVEGLTQWRPLVLGLLSVVLASALAALGTVVAVGGGLGTLLAGMLSLLVLVVLFGGISAVGVMLMDQARGVPVRSLAQAAWRGVQCIPKFLGFALVLCALGLAFAAVAAVLYWLCQIPYLGVVLAFVVHPALVLLGAGLLMAVGLVAAPLFAPAVWSGLGLKAALAQLVRIVSKRWLQVVVMLLVLYLLLMVVSGILALGLVPALASLTSLAATILAQGPAVGLYADAWLSPAALLWGGMSSGAMGAALMGLGVLMLAVGALLMQVWMLGLNLLYLQVADGQEAEN